MADAIITLRVDEKIREKMREIEHINWSSVLRKALIEELEKMKQTKQIQIEKAFTGIDRIKKSGVFNNGKSGAELVREWRNKRRS